MIKAIIRKFLWIALLATSLIVAATYVYSSAIHKQVTSNQNDVTFIISTGDNIRVISRSLNEQGVINQPAWMVELYARLNNQATRIKAGEFNIEPGMTIPELIALFVDGKVVMHAFTIVEGLTTQELLHAIQANPKITHTLSSYSADSILELLGMVDESHPEGLFLPETYHFPAGTTDSDFLLRSHQQLKATLDAAWQKRADNLPYKSPYEALIMASIIEKETAAADERELISGVFVRRLEKGMRLQTDPTVIYGLGDNFDGNLRKKDLRADTPYNTYTRFGLPPSPICLPSTEAIEAALHPADGDSLYFVATGKDGRHAFSSNLKDHNNAVRRYQLKK